MANKVFVDVVFRKDKKSDLIKTAEKEARVSGKKAGDKFGEGFNKRATVQVRGLNGILGNLKNNLAGLAAGFVAFRVLGGFLREGLQGAREFSRGIAEVNSILPQNEKLVKSSIDTFSRFASTFATTQAQQAKAFYSIVSAGVKTTSKQLETLEVANRAAVAGLVDINTAAVALVSSVNAYSKAGLTAEEASDSLFVAVREGQTTFGELSSFLGNVSAIASSAGVKFDELTATVAALTKGGIETSKATIALRGALTAIIKPTDEAKKAAKTLGIEFNTASLRSKGLVKFLKEIGQKTGGSTDALAKLFGNVRGLSGVLKIINGDFNDFVRIQGEVANKSGASQKALNEIRKSLDFKLDQLSKEFRGLGVDILALVSGPMKTFVVGLRQIVKAVRPSKEKTKIDQLREQLKGVTPELNRVIETLRDQNKIEKQIRASGNKDYAKSLKVRFGFLKAQRARILAAIRAEEKKISEERVSANKSANNKIASQNANALLKANELGLLSLEDLRRNEATKANILINGTNARFAQMGINHELELEKIKEQNLTKEQILMEHEQRKAQIVAQFEQQKTAIQETTAAKRTAIATAEFLGLSKQFKSFGDQSIKVGKIINNGISKAIGGSMQAVGRALATGQNAFQAFGEAVKAAIGEIASAIGDAFIQKGVGLSILGDPRGGPLIAVGAGLKLLSGFLGASGSSTPSGASTGGGTGGAPVEVLSSIETAEEPEVRESGPRVALTIEGNVFDTDDTRRSIVDFLNEEFSEGGASLENASFA